MATVYKRKRNYPIPPGAEIITYRGKAYVKWIDPATGKAERAPLNTKGDKIVKESPFYMVQFFDHEGKRKKVYTRYPDKDAAQQYANQLERDAEDRRRGMVDTAQERFAHEARRPLVKHAAEFRGFLQDKGRTVQHVKQTARQIEVIAEACIAEYIGDLTGAAVQRAIGELRDAGKSLRTCNSHLASIKAFVRWLWKEKRTPDNALAGLSKYNEETDKRHERRELSEDELRWLLTTTETQGKLNYNLDATTRTMAYRVALGSGFRTNELRTLTPASFDLDADPPTVTAKAAYSKRRREDVQPIPKGLAEHLRPWLANQPRGGQVFRLPHNTSKMFQRDLAAARAARIEAAETEAEREALQDGDFLQYEDSAGKFADFYATRHTYISGIVAGGASVKTCQELARHSTPVLTIGRYSHARLHDLTGALEALPDLQPQDSEGQERRSQRVTGTDGRPADEMRGHMRGQLGVKTCLNVARRGQEEGQNASGAECLETIVFPGKTAVSQGKRAVVRGGFEPPTHGFSVSYFRRICHDTQVDRSPSFS